MRIGELEFDEGSLNAVKKAMASLGSSYIINESDDNSDDYVQVLFVSKYEGREVLFDAAIYTLYLHHESELYDAAEKQAMKKFPRYRELVERGVEIRGGMLPADVEEQIGIFITETMLDLEEDEAVKVKEYIEVDEELEHRIGLDVCLNVDKITPEVVEKFIADFTAGQLKLDPTLYSFQSDDDEE